MRKRTDNPYLENPGRMEEEIKSRSRIFSHLSATVLGILFVFTLSQFNLDGLKGILVDALYRTQWWSRPDPSISLIAYDDQSSRRYDSGRKFPAEEIVQILDFLAEEKPLAVAILAPINEKLYSDTELALIGKGL